MTNPINMGNDSAKTNSIYEKAYQILNGRKWWIGVILLRELQQILIQNLPVKLYIFLININNSRMGSDFYLKVIKLIKLYQNDNILIAMASFLVILAELNRYTVIRYVMTVYLFQILLNQPLLSDQIMTCLLEKSSGG